jgi:hypothetical protein
VQNRLHVVTLDPVSQSASHPCALSYTGSLGSILALFSRQVDLNDDLTKIINCLGDYFQDELAQA